MHDFELGIIGAGNMAEGVVAAVVAKGPYPAGRVLVADPVAERRQRFESHYGTTATGDSREVAWKSRRILLAVKPQNFDEVAAALADVVSEEQVLISIMAGVSTRRIAEAFPRIEARVVRVMPNLPICLGAGIAGVFGGRHATESDVAEARAIFDAGGATIAVESERLIDAVTAVSGSGPAYFYYFVEAIVAGGVACGLSEQDALKLAQHTCLGAARMMLETHEPPAELRRKVTSKGGTTQAAIEHLERSGAGDLIRDAVRKAFDRAQELGA
ncbi:MAG: pyrroline-5-carboxylate reductase [Phycisphaerae bacterium]